MSLKYESTLREPLVDGVKDYHQVTEDIISPIEGKPGKLWYVGFLISLSLLGFGAFSVFWQIYFGVGVWNLNKTIGWGWDITNFVWWVGIGHAGTLISAILLLFRQGWRTGVNRAAEAMTIFAVMCAGQFPIIHMGRVWMGFFILPYPNTRGPVWVNFNSPLLWDVFAISTYFTVSLLFWYSGLIPDFATIRDRAKTKLRKLLYGVASFGWTGSTKHWQRHEALSLVLAGLSTPLVLSVHTIVSFDFATSVIPGWHTTIFPPYFVAGAIFSGFAMVQTLLIITRKILHLEEYITLGHMEAMNKVIVLTGSVVGCAYLTELFMAWYGANPYEFATFFKYRAAGPLGWSYWIMMTCNVITPQVFWFRKMRRNVMVTFVMSIIVNIGMWFERFVIICTSLYRDYLPSSWSYYRPSWPEVGFYMGTFGLFFTCYFLFAKYFPVIAVAEIKSILKTSGENFKEGMEKYEGETAEQFAHAVHHEHAH
ncbi:polysulfide reductase NrfD [Chitinophaga oryzae]|uniref:Polysulfide reductase NrfD n=2 Tax=Chitinophaga TaxID=79328 RepID=A0AAE6ZM51_9BACT|nr:MULTISPECIES: NrfD/PsrC family molybdoenzyme membrane anchor subunit [Chitinophaga]QJB34658.1 polysulfide reductase NrfD [Chitinophaga oryzae]QJB41176.1 polysulfide reductase NrfD [Chitinophaga oryzae]SKA12433.1 quinol:cytochrome c oxidoreductase quinone-binding subunit 1 [Chitinophaga eiseniae]